jgi:hypothetical protein
MQVRVGWRVCVDLETRKSDSAMMPSEFTE